MAATDSSFPSSESARWQEDHLGRVPTWTATDTGPSRPRHQTPAGAPEAKHTRTQTFMFFIRFLELFTRLHLLRFILCELPRSIAATWAETNASVASVKYVLNRQDRYLSSGTDLPQGLEGSWIKFIRAAH